MRSSKTASLGNKYRTATIVQTTGQNHKTITLPYTKGTTTRINKIFLKYNIKATSHSYFLCSVLMVLMHIIALGLLMFHRGGFLFPSIATWTQICFVVHSMPCYQKQFFEFCFPLHCNKTLKPLWTYTRNSASWDQPNTSLLKTMVYIKYLMSTATDHTRAK